jgi:hypothetical protein
MRRDRRQDGAAYPAAGWVLRVGASRRIAGPETREEAHLANRYTLQALAGVAVLRRSAYPAAEF